MSFHCMKNISGGWIHDSLEKDTPHRRPVETKPSPTAILATFTSITIAGSDSGTTNATGINDSGHIVGTFLMGGVQHVPPLNRKH
jgi:hypothetical protein